MLWKQNLVKHQKVSKYYENDCRFNGVYCGDNLPKKIKDWACVINLDEYADVGTHWIALYNSNIEIIYFASFSVGHVPKEIKNIKTNIFRIQAKNSIMCQYFCTGFIDFILAGKTLIDYTSLFLPYDFIYFLVILKMNECNSIKLIYIQIWVLAQTKFRLNEINKFKNSFNSKIQKRKTMSKKLNKYIANFDYFDKIVLSATSGAISIISFTSVIGVLVGIQDYRNNKEII